MKVGITSYGSKGNVSKCVCANMVDEKVDENAGYGECIFPFAQNLQEKEEKKTSVVSNSERLARSDGGRGVGGSGGGSAPDTLACQ